MRLLHTMLRVKNLDESISFYVNALGMSLLRKNENKEYEYTLAFLGYGDERKTTVLELTYNWGSKGYQLGNGFGHIAIETEDINSACNKITENDGIITRQPGPVKGGQTVIAFAKDPDGYMIELIEKREGVHDTL